MIVGDARGEVCRRNLTLPKVRVTNICVAIEILTIMCISEVTLDDLAGGCCQFLIGSLLVLRGNRHTDTRT